MAMVEITTMVPVVVKVDTETGEVVQVVVDDESIEFDNATYGEATEADRVAAQAIANNPNLEWPMWQFGW